MEGKERSVPWVAYPRHKPSISDPAPQYVTQRQDHFDGANQNSWQQAFFVNDTFWKPGSSAPVFLCVGGEGDPLDGSAVVRSVHCNVAVEWLQETGALMFALEHRYYGCHNAAACPVDDLRKPGALKFLSSRQALNDIALFVRHATQTYGLSKSKWVTWGGSYPGMLAGWARLSFPHLIHASVASSAPVRAELDMRGYNDVVAAAFAVEDNQVGGSQSCHDAIALGHREAGEMFSSEDGRKKLSQIFGEKPEFYAKRENQHNFAGMGIAEFPAQENDPMCSVPMCNIAKICQAMLNVSLGSEVQRLAHVRDIQNAVEEEEESSPASTPGFDDVDLWGYQTCAEFGFYQTCEMGSKCFYTQGFNSLDDEMGVCGEDFNISKEAVAKNIAFSNEYYGADHPQGTRVLYVNGEVDPWHANSINAPLTTDLPALWVQGASHHAWTHPSTESDQESVKAVRVKIRTQVTAFLGEEGSGLQGPATIPQIYV